MKRRLILVLLLAGSLVTTYIRINDRDRQTKSAKVHSGMVESEAERILTNLGTAPW